MNDVFEKAEDLRRVLQESRESVRGAWRNAAKRDGALRALAEAEAGLVGALLAHGPVDASRFPKDVLQLLRDVLTEGGGRVDVSAEYKEKLASRGKRPRFCVVFNSTTSGRPNRVLSCSGGRAGADREAARLNRTGGDGGWYSVSPEPLVRERKRRGDEGWDWGPIT